MLTPAQRHVPGTTLLEDHTTRVDADTLAHLKRGKGRYSHIILSPQPSDDPKDPLSWPQWKKELVFYSILFQAGIVGGVGPLLAPGYAVIAEEWGVSVNAVAATNGWLVLALGLIMLLAAPACNKFGRRPVYIVASLMLFTGAIWGGVAESIGSFQGARIWQGFGMAPFETLVMTTVGDIFFVHERGWRSALFGFSIIAGVNITPIVNGYVIDSELGYRWCEWLVAIVHGIALLLIFFVVPETVYVREQDEVDGEFVDNSKGTTQHLEGEKAASRTSSRSTTPSGVATKGRTYSPPSSYLASLSPWSGYVGPDSFIKTLVRPFPFFISPVVIWGFLTYGMTTAFLVVVSVVSSVVFGGPPYNFDAGIVGLMSIGPLIASFIGMVISGPAVDWMARYLAKRNNGVFEAEFRLPALLVMLVCEIIGFAVWGAVQSAGGPWIGPEILYSLINLGQTFGSTAIVAYVLDCHRADSADAFTVIGLAKNLVLFGFTQFASQWVIDQGILQVFGILAGLTAFCILTTIPMWIYGKRVRSWIARHQHVFMH